MNNTSQGVESKFINRFLKFLLNLNFDLVVNWVIPRKKVVFAETNSTLSLKIPPYPTTSSKSRSHTTFPSKNQFIQRKFLEIRVQNLDLPNRFFLHSKNNFHANSIK